MSEPPTAATPPPDAEPARRRPFAFVRRPIARVVQLGLRYRVLGCVLLLLGTLVVCGALSVLFNVGTGRLSSRDELVAPITMLPINDAGTAINPSDDGAAEFMAAMIAFDAQRMWGTYSESIRSQRAAQGQTVAELQRRFDEAKRAGARIDEARRIGAYPLRDGGAYVFYVVTRSGFPPDGGTEQIYFVFTLDSDGHVVNVI